MKRFDLAHPCCADFGAMAPVPGGRFCDDCEKVVHDLSALSEAEARKLLARTPADRVCVRYVYDRTSGDVVFGARAEDRSRLIPEHRLLARLKSRVAMAAAIAAPLLVEACGGNDGNYRDRSGDPRQQDDLDLGQVWDDAEYEATDGGADGAASPAEPGAAPEFPENPAANAGQQDPELEAELDPEFDAEQPSRDAVSP